MKNQRLTPVTDPSEIRKILELEPIHSLKFHCLRYGHDTNGVHEDGQTTVRTCPRCHSVLIFCPICRTCTSTKERYKVLICDKCQTNFVTDTTVKYLQAREHESAEIVLSGIRATGQMHLGNFFGAVDKFVKYQRGPNFCMFFIADWHTLTTCKDPKTIGLNTIGIAMDYVAAGLDPERSLIYAQSSVPEIAELALLLSMFQLKNALENIPTLRDLLKPKKDTAGQEQTEPITMGLLYYPVLMAADILGPKATLIPVGKDQEPNVELASKLAQKFNRLFGPVFSTPRISRSPVVPSLTGGKMAKSETNSCIVLTDTRVEIERKYMKFGVTDPAKITRNAKGTPEKCVSVYPLFTILHGANGEATKEVAEGCRVGTLGCRDCKLRLAGDLDQRLAPFREKRRALESKRDFASDVLHFGGLKAREIYAPTLEEVRSKLGLLPA